MKEERVSVFGKDAEEHDKRAFDWILVNGQPYMETKDRHGNKVRTPVNRVVAGYEQLKRKQAGNATV